MIRSQETLLRTSYTSPTTPSPPYMDTDHSPTALRSSHPVDPIVDTVRAFPFPFHDLSGNFLEAV